MAKVTKAFKGVPDGDVYPVEFNEGDEVTGGLAEAMVAAGYAVEAKEAPQPSTKSRGNAPENK